MQLDIFPVGYDTTGFSYRGYEIYIKPYHSYLLFYTVDEYKSEVTVFRVLQDREDWQFIMTTIRFRLPASLKKRGSIDLLMFPLFCY
ncbi:MAG: hypothetical protein J6L77_05745 [Coprococcus sp.]|nr:hypothetical protein [Coprococcus sp.]